MLMSKAAFFCCRLSICCGHDTACLMLSLVLVMYSVQLLPTALLCSSAMVYTVAVLKVALMASLTDCALYYVCKI